MTIVAVSQRVDQFPDRKETRDALDQRLINLLARVGAYALPTPNNLGLDIHAWLRVMRPKAIVLSGGNDLGLNSDRDLTELALLNYAEQNGLPVLGICRGMQMMGHWAGMGLHRVSGHERVSHDIIGEIAGQVNSYHAFSLDDCPTGFEVLARSLDGEIEAIRHTSLIWEGWMWHPEREEFGGTSDLFRIKSILCR